MTIAIVGSNGGIGQRLVSQLRSHYSSPRTIGLDRQPTTDVDEINEYFQVDLLNLLEGSSFENAVVEVLSNADVVVMLAGAVHDRNVTEEVYHNLNIAAPVTILELFRKARGSAGVFIFASTVSVYGAADGLYDETSRCTPSAPYAISKYQAEIALKDITASNDAPKLWTLRLGTIISRNDRGNLNRLIRAASQYHVVPKVRDGIKKSFVHIDDVTHVITEIARQNTVGNGGTFNVCGPVVDLREIFDSIASVAGRCLRPQIPHGVLRMVSPTMAHSVEIDSEAIQAKLGLQLHPFHEGFQKEYLNK